MTFQPTEEQLAIVSAATETTDNLLISALAGAAKTSTLVLVAEALPSTSILCLAFNKRIQLEMKDRLPANCQAMTLNGLGHRAWMDATGRRLNLDTGKSFKILTDLVSALPNPQRSAVYERFADLLKLIGFGKQCGYVPSGKFEKAKRLMSCDEFFSHIEQKLTPIEEDLIRQATIEGLDQALKGTIDFDDQILMPTIFHGVFPRFPLVLVDESQDLSSLNHAMLRKLAKKRIIAVGDSRQAIYGFRGAHEDSMNLLGKEFAMRELELSVSFRCPQAVVDHVLWRAPHMKYPTWAKTGIVQRLPEWGVNDLPQSAAVICRNNAPLFSLAIKLLKQGRHSEVGSTDIAKQLLKIMTKFGEKKLIQPDVLDKIDAWERKEIDKTRRHGHGPIQDKAECMRVFAQAGSTLGDALHYINHLINSSSPLKLMTGHKSKGLEFDHVFFLDEELVGPDDQDPNLRYVICTRAKETLTYVNSGDFL